MRRKLAKQLIEAALRVQADTTLGQRLNWCKNTLEDWRKQVRKGGQTTVSRRDCEELERIVNEASQDMRALNMKLYSIESFINSKD